VIRPRFLLAAGLIVASCLATPQVIRLSGAESLPDALSDREFWKITTEFSEADGYFRSDNLLSNELTFPYILSELEKKAPTSRVYMGVGPEQNFNYIAVLRPKMAFIVDVRQDNLRLHMMYKALFRLANDRADFVSLLFSRRRPAGLSAASTPEQIFAAYAAAGVETTDELYRANLKAIFDELIEIHGFALTPDDLNRIEKIYGAFTRFGPEIRYSSNQGGGGFGGMNQPSYAELMMADDIDGRPASYLANEQSFRVVKDLEARNLLVPVVGNFGGPKAIRAVAQYLKEHDALVSAFYLSNVEMYLNQQNLWEKFCRNVAALPLDDHSFFIRSARGGGYGRGIGLNLALAPIAGEVKDCQ
jgi:hypothetical protein